MPDYSKGKIYRIVNNENDKVYYGSTCCPLHKRLYEHRKKHNDCMSKKLCLDLKECQIILVENVNCNNKQELLMRERFYIENNECVNRNIPTRTQKEYVKDNKEKINERTKKWVEKNIIKLRKQRNERYNNNKEEISKKAKLYRIENKEIVLKRKTEYYQKNKEIIREKAKEQIICSCGNTYRKNHKARHERSKKHQEFIK